MTFVYITVEFSNLFHRKSIRLVLFLPFVFKSKYFFFLVVKEKEHIIFIMFESNLLQTPIFYLCCQKKKHVFVVFCRARCAIKRIISSDIMAGANDNHRQSVRHDDHERIRKQSNSYFFQKKQAFHV